MACYRFDYKAKRGASVWRKMGESVKKGPVGRGFSGLDAAQLGFLMFLSVGKTSVDGKLAHFEALVQQKFAEFCDLTGAFLGVDRKVEHHGNPHEPIAAEHYGTRSVAVERLVDHVTPWAWTMMACASSSGTRPFSTALRRRIARASRRLTAKEVPDFGSRLSEQVRTPVSMMEIGC